MFVVVAVFAIDFAPHFGRNRYGGARPIYRTLIAGTELIGHVELIVRIKKTIEENTMQLIYPMFAMVILTAIVGACMAYIRIRSAYSGEVDHRYFRLMSNYEIPERIAKFGRNFDNLLEVPVLFYAACLASLTINFSSQSLLVLAWVFVSLRIAHTLIHLTYNNPLHRFFPFMLSFICVVAMWVDIVIGVHKNVG